jgi:short-subunit dehydrogenase
MVNMKTIVITGATSGIGNLLVKEFIKQGCLVFAGYKNIKLKKDLEQISENVIPFRIDMSKTWTITDAIKFINEKTEKIDTLINAAGCVIAGPMECLSVDKIREQFEINTFSHLQFTQGLFEKLQGGRIINISSEASFGIYPFIAPYCASKRALDILFNSMQIECQGEIKVISIKPGVIKTPLWEKSIENNKDVLGDNSKYEKEFNYLMKNAEKNKKTGLDAQKVADLIVEIEGLKKPKASYTIGFDAKCAEILSHFPQNWINMLVKKSLQLKMT